MDIHTVLTKVKRGTSNTDILTICEELERLLAIKGRKRGRPRIGEVRSRPWEGTGMSRRTWYRRQKENPFI